MDVFWPTILSMANWPSSMLRWRTRIFVKKFFSDSRMAVLCPMSCCESRAGAIRDAHFRVSDQFIRFIKTENRLKREFIGAQPEFNVTVFSVGNELAESSWYCFLPENYNQNFISPSHHSVSNPGQEWILRYRLRRNGSAIFIVAKISDWEIMLWISNGTWNYTDEESKIHSVSGRNAHSLNQFVFQYVKWLKRLKTYLAVRTWIFESFRRGRSEE